MNNFSCLFVRNDYDETMEWDKILGFKLAGRNLWRLLGGASRLQIVYLVFLQLLTSLSEGVGIMLLVPLLTGLLGGRGWWASKWLGQLTGGHSFEGVLFFFVLVIVARALAQHLQQTQSIKLQNEIIDGLRLRCFAALQNAEWRWLVTRRTSDHTHVLMNNMSRIGFGLSQALTMTTTLVMVAGYLITAMLLSWKMALFALFCGLLVHLFFARQRAEASRLGEAIRDAARTMQAHINEGLVSIRLSKILGNERRHVDSFGAALLGARTRQLEFTHRSSLGRAWLQIGGAIVLVILLGVGVDVWHLALSQLFPSVVVFARLIPMLASLQQTYYYWLSAIPALDETDALLADCAAVAEPVADNERPLSLDRELRFDAVSFSYPGRDVPALRDIGLNFKARTTSAIVGTSGAGKSTLADLMVCLLTPDDGQILMDGVALQGAERQRWRRSVAYVQQDAFLFHDTIRNNLLWARPDASVAQLSQALNTAAADFVSAFPEGIDTIVGDGGVRLSGGERQRIALARALLGAPTLLILDEATSALDPENEAAIRRAIEALNGDLTVIIIGHRLAFLDQADQVIRLSEGRVVAVDQTRQQDAAA